MTKEATDLRSLEKHKAAEHVQNTETISSCTLMVLSEKANV